MSCRTFSSRRPWSGTTAGHAAFAFILSLFFSAASPDQTCARKMPSPARRFRSRVMPRAAAAVSKSRLAAYFPMYHHAIAAPPPPSSKTAFCRAKITKNVAITWSSRHLHARSPSPSAPLARHHAQKCHATPKTKRMSRAVRKNVTPPSLVTLHQALGMRIRLLARSFAISASFTAVPSRRVSCLVSSRSQCARLVIGLDDAGSRSRCTCAVNDGNPRKFAAVDSCGGGSRKRCRRRAAVKRPPRRSSSLDDESRRWQRPTCSATDRASQQSPTGAAALFRASRARFA